MYFEAADLQLQMFAMTMGSRLTCCRLKTRRPMDVSEKVLQAFADHCPNLVIMDLQTSDHIYNPVPNNHTHASATSAYFRSVSKLSDKGLLALVRACPKLQLLRLGEGIPGNVAFMDAMAAEKRDAYGTKLTIIISSTTRFLLRPGIEPPAARWTGDTGRFSVTAKDFVDALLLDRKGEQARAAATMVEFQVKERYGQAYSMYPPPLSTF